MITLDDIDGGDLQRIQAAAAETAAPNAKLRDLEAREADQGTVVAALQKQLAEARAVDLTLIDDPDEIHAARLRVSDLQDELNVELRLLQAIQTAIINTREAGKSVTGELGHAVDRAVAAALLTSEDRVVEAFERAAFELLALFVGRHGAGHAVGACERRFDLATRNPDLVRRINQHYAELKATLFEAV